MLSLYISLHQYTYTVYQLYILFPPVVPSLAPFRSEPIRTGTYSGRAGSPPTIRYADAADACLPWLRVTFLHTPSTIIQSQCLEMRPAALALSGACLLASEWAYATPVGSGAQSQVPLEGPISSSPQSKTSQQLHGRFLHITGTLLCIIIIFFFCTGVAVC